MANLRTKIVIILLFLLIAATSQAAVYHIDPTAGSGGDGSAASPFDSWSDLPSMSTGDDVYFKCGTTFSATSSLSVSWEGTSENRVVIGAYWMDGATAKYELNGDRPIISGNNYSYPSTEYTYTGMINIGNKDYVTVENLEIKETRGQGINIYGDVDAGTNSAYFVLRNVKVNGCNRSGFLVNKNQYNYGLIEDCEVVYNARLKALQLDVQSAAIVVANSPYSYTTIKGCYVHHGHGEGISSTRVLLTDTYDNSGYVAAVGNTIMAMVSACLYQDGTHYNTYRNNLVIGLSDEALGGAWYNGGYGNLPTDGRFWTPTGIGFSTEDRLEGQEVSSNNTYYNNIVVGCKYGLYIGQEASGASSNNKFYNNTFIGNWSNLRFGGILSSSTLAGYEIKNNIFWSPADCNSTNIVGDGSWIDSKIDMDYNAWTGTKPTYAGGTNDIVLSSSDSSFEKTTGWQGLDGLIDADNAKIKSTSDLVDEGYDLSGIFTDDYFGDTRGATWDIGADEYVSPGGITPTTYNVTWLTSAPTIDGVLTDWSGVTETIILTDPLSGKVGTYKIAADATALYLSGSISDTNLNATRTTRDSDLWWDDSIEFWLGSVIATDDDKETTDRKYLQNITGYYGDNIGTGASSCDTAWTPTITNAVVNTGTLNDTNADTGHTFETKILWSDLPGGTYPGGGIWQMDLRQNDRADDDSKTSVDWVNSDGGDANNPTGWGRIVFPEAVATGLVSFYDFESGALTTDSEGSNTLTNNNAATESTDSKVNSGSTDLESGSSQYYSVADASLSSGFPLKSDDSTKVFTWACWFKVESFSAGMGLISKYDGTANKRSAHLSVREIDSTSTYQVRVQLGYNSGADGEEIAHASTLSANTWYFVALSYDNSDKSYAIRLRDANGNTVGSDVTGTATLDASKLYVSDAPFVIGALGAPTQYFDGLIDGVRIYNEVLTSGEVDTLADVGPYSQANGASLFF